MDLGGVPRTAGEWNPRRWGWGVVIFGNIRPFLGQLEIFLSMSCHCSEDIFFANLEKIGQLFALFGPFSDLVTSFGSFCYEACFAHTLSIRNGWRRNAWEPQIERDGEEAAPWPWDSRWASLAGRASSLQRVRKWPGRARYTGDP